MAHRFFDSRIPSPATPTRRVLTLACASLLLLPGCPLSDDYFLEPSVPLGGTAGRSAGGAAGSAGASQLSGGMTSTGGKAGVAGSCLPVCSAGRACNAGVCQGGWVSMAEPPASFAAREKAAYTSFNGKVFIFGGLDASGDALDSAAIYDPLSNLWTLVSIDDETPEPRQLATAVWTGSKIVVWGGRDDANDSSYSDGASYDPASDTWAQLPDNARGRVAPMGGASGGNLFFWSGWNASFDVQERGERYRLNDGSWAAAATDNDPGKLLHASWSFSSDALYVYGGRVDGSTATDRAFRYSFAANAWTTLPRGPSARWGGFSAWDGSRFYVWGGSATDAARNDGKVLLSSWADIEKEGAPSARWAAQRQLGWAFAVGPSDVVFIGGFNMSAASLHDGGRYDAELGTWKKVEAWKASDDHDWSVATWTGREFVLWGGGDRGDSRISNEGERWAP